MHKNNVMFAYRLENFICYSFNSTYMTFIEMVNLWIKLSDTAQI